MSLLHLRDRTSILLVAARAWRKDRHLDTGLCLWQVEEGEAKVGAGEGTLSTSSTAL